MNSEPECSVQVKLEKPKCSVCNEPGDGLHFGAEACRACTAFFRRSVSLNRKYVCRENGDCMVFANVRCVCRACRFQKCLLVGMREDCVQPKREAKDSPDLDKPSSSTGHISISMSSYRPHYSGMEMLERMKLNYEKLETARFVIHRSEGDNIFSIRQPRACNFQEAAITTCREVTPVADWITACFDDFAGLPIDQKNILFQNFFVYFTMFEASFKSHLRPDLPNVIILPCGKYIDMNNLVGFFSASNVQGEISPEQTAKTFESSFSTHKRSLINLMTIECIDLFEFFAMATMLLWDFGLENQTDECGHIGRHVKQQVTREIAYYLRFVKNIDEPLIRMSNVVSLLPALQRVVRRFQEDIEMAHLFKIYELPEGFADIINQKFDT